VSTVCHLLVVNLSMNKAVGEAILVKAGCRYVEASIAAVRGCHLLGGSFGSG
jgi:hypothetical protein